MLSRDEILSLIHRTSAIAETMDSATIVNGFLEEAMACYHASFGLVFLQSPNDRLLLRATKGDFSDQKDFLSFVTTAKQIARRTEQLKSPILCQCTACIKDEFHLPSIRTFSNYTSLMSYPLINCEKIIGVILVMNYDPQVSNESIELINLRLTSELQKTLEIEAKTLHNERLLSLINTIGQIGSTLDENEILESIIKNGRLLTNAEGCSLFLLEEETNEIVLTLSSNLDQNIDRKTLEIRVPFGQGIIGNVIESGEPAIVQDTKQDTRHYKKPDNRLGFATRSLLAVPMRSRTINLQSFEDEVSAHIIGGLEAVNKIGGDFSEEDQQILQILANQTATILEIARAYHTINEIFIDVTRALSAAIDAKDPYTVGHSLRVSNFAKTLAEQMGLSPGVVQQIRLGGLLHDVGKIGIPDNILKKSDTLSPDEYNIIMDHPSIGHHIMDQVHRMDKVIPGLMQHHERLDGSGYPEGLMGDEISLSAKIIAVADVFDALTSDRPYRDAYPIEEAFRILRSEETIHLDKICIDALIRAYQDGKIKPQKEIKTGELQAFFELRS
jgi:putative nucleotidyltransferase with HDIG domain